MNCFRRLFCLFATLSALVSSACVAAPVPVPGERAYPEGLSSSSDGTLYIGRVGDGGIVRKRPGSQSEIWIAPGAFGSRSIFGVLVDERSGTLWACSDDMQAYGLPSPGTGKATLKGFDLKTGRGEVSAELPGDNRFCVDIAALLDTKVPHQPVLPFQVVAVSLASQ
jgi:hypothetical protein